MYPEGQRSLGDGKSGMYFVDARVHSQLVLLGESHPLEEPVF